MSQSKRFCMEIANSPEYRGLVSAMESDQTEKALEYFYAIGNKVDEFRGGVLKKIEEASQVKDRPDFVYGHAKKDAQQFIDSFNSEAQKYIPVWLGIYEGAKKIKEAGIPKR